MRCPEPARRIGTVQMDSILADFAARAVPGEAAAGDTGTGAADWPPGLDAGGRTRGGGVVPGRDGSRRRQDYTFDVELELARSTGGSGF